MHSASIEADPTRDVPHNCTLDLIFNQGRSYTLTSFSYDPIDVAVNIIRPLYGICTTARRHYHDHPIPDNPSRRVYEASVVFYGRTNPWASRVCVKYAAGEKAVADLLREAKMYCYELRHVAGVAVPKFYSFFTGTDESRRPIACMITELCRGDGVILDPKEFKCVFRLYHTDCDAHWRRVSSRRVMLAVCQIHQAGVVHNGLYDYHHFVMQGARVCVVDFSRATTHSCGNCIPSLANSIYDVPSWCSELYHAEQRFGRQA
ncbi:hypothetical protein EVG20_g3949 [Dentipellis fragilis]|uniref:Protein kinase domain-containing protein n=1 Tax=Dentipellis fragilis TaxID=205917 RepID=A0A4Y9YXV1_9AGAM|nr:hypothetical protein EVG20_g3949 [Dentipellis fragilis]